MNVADIPVAILCGGLGTRLKEETESIPKPLIPIGGRPILWHIMKIYYAQGFRRFYLLLGYRAEKIREYFYHDLLLGGETTISLNPGGMRVNANNVSTESWEITFLDTGLDTQTGGRIKYLQSHIKDGTFLLTYGDGVSDINLKKLLTRHAKNGTTATLTAVHPPGRFGELITKKGKVVKFVEKPRHPTQQISGGFFALEADLLRTLPKRISLNFEREILPKLAQSGKLGAYEHEGFWQCMDTLKDVEVLQNIWKEGKAPWKLWK